MDGGDLKVLNFTPKPVEDDEERLKQLTEIIGFLTDNATEIESLAVVYQIPDGDSGTVHTGTAWTGMDFADLFMLAGVMDIHVKSALVAHQGD